MAKSLPPTIEEILEPIERYGGLPSPDILSAQMDILHEVPSESAREILATAVKSAVRGRELKGLVAARQARTRDHWRAIEAKAALGEFVYENEVALVGAMNEKLALLIRKEPSFLFSEGGTEIVLDRDGASIVFAKYGLLAKSGEIIPGFDVWLKSRNRREQIQNR